MLHGSKHWQDKKSMIHEECQSFIIYKALDWEYEACTGCRIQDADALRLYLNSGSMLIGTSPLGWLQACPRSL